MFRLTLLLLLCTTIANAQAAFVTTWKTDNPGNSENHQITIPTFTGEVYDYTIDWGDGTSDTHVTGDMTHSYALPGVYEVSIDGTFPRIFFNDSGDADKILNIKQWGDIPWVSMESAFAGCSNLSVAAGDTPDLSRVTSLRRMFFFCQYTFDYSRNREYSNFNGIENFNDWDVSTITDMSNMFDKSSFNQDISSWDTSNVTNMSYLFFSSRFNQEIDVWNVSKVQNMEGIFGSSLFNQDVTGWDVSSVANMDFMFNSTYFDQDISSWDVRNVTSMRHMLSQCSFNQDISNWNVASVIDMSHIFDDNDLSRENYDKILMGWSQLPSLRFGTILGAKDVKYCLGRDAREFLISTYHWSIVDQGENCEEDRPFVTTWKTDNPGPSGNNQITIPTNPYEVYDYDVDWGDGSKDTGITEDVTHTYAAPGTYRVSISGRFPHIYFNNGGADYPVQFPRKTSDLEKIVSIDQWGTIRWNSMSFAFAGCTNLDVLATDTPDFSKGIHMSHMFYRCVSLKGNKKMSQWDLSESDFSAPGMFSGATQFDQPIGDWDVSNIRYMDSMFQNASSFNQNLENWDIGIVENMDAMFDGSGMSISNYDKLLNAWSGLPNLFSNVKLGASNIKYCDGEDARQKLMDSHGWEINDGGKAPYCNQDNDVDGVLDHFDDCLNTNDGAVVDANGCEILPADAVKIYSQIPTCVNESNGSILITSTLSDYFLDIAISGNGLDVQQVDISSNQTHRIENLAAGLHTIKIKVQNTSYEKVFGVDIDEVSSVSGKRVSLDIKNKTAKYQVSGSQLYNVEINGKSKIFEFDSTSVHEIELIGLNDINNVAISGQTECQGLVEETFHVNNEIFVHPVLTNGLVFIQGIEATAYLMVYDMAGRIIIEKEINPDKKEDIDLSSYGSGVYPIKIITKGKAKELKVIKQ